MNKEQKLKILQYRIMLNSAYGDYNKEINEYAWGKINEIRSSFNKKPILKKMIKFKLL
jgi:hypothetical protein